MASNNVLPYIDKISNLLTDVYKDIIRDPNSSSSSAMAKSKKS